MANKKQAAKRRKVSKEDDEVTKEVDQSREIENENAEKEMENGIDNVVDDGVEEENLSEEEDIEPRTVPPEAILSDGKYRNKQRCLTISSRGVPARFRHLLEDLRTLMPHHKKESKLDPGAEGVAQAVNDIAGIRGCNSVLFLECRKRQDCYMWLGRTGADAKGPSARFHVSNVHTMDELRLTGNCMKGSRPILTFDNSFEKFGHLKLLRELFTEIFGTPRGHPKAKPFVDRVMAFYYADRRIWVRNYQILEQQPANAKEAHQVKKSGHELSTSLVEIGPRFVLNPIRIFRGSFGGQTLYRNPDYISPNATRAMERKAKGMAYEERKNSQNLRKERKAQIVVPEDPLDSVFR